MEEQIPKWCVLDFQKGSICYTRDIQLLSYNGSWQVVMDCTIMMSGNYSDALKSFKEYISVSKRNAKAQGYTLTKETRNGKHNNKNINE